MPYAGLSGDAVPDDLRILDLDTILDYLEGVKPFRYIIEVKNGGDLGKRSVDILYQALKQRSMVDRVVFGSFQDEVSLYKDEKYPDLVRGAFIKEVVRFYYAALTNAKDYEPAFRVLQLPFDLPENDHHLNLATARIINYAHEHDLAVQYWTINNAEDAEYLMSIGADCVMSDYPDMAYDVRAGQ
jgi:glycerophosphoryl diester phosphodiesterase